MHIYYLWRCAAPRLRAKKALRVRDGHKTHIEKLPPVVRRARSILYRGSSVYEYRLWCGAARVFALARSIMCDIKVCKYIVFGVARKGFDAMNGN